MDNPSPHTLKKEERLSIQKEIDTLFAEGISFISYPLRIVYVKQKPLQGVASAVLISVPKKRFKRAVKRNRLKRLTREAYRLNKTALLNALAQHESGLLIAFLYVGKEVCSYAEMEAAMKQALSRLIKGVES